MSFKLTTTSVLEFDTKEEVENVIAMMPWDQEDKDKLFQTGEHIEIETTELDGEEHEVSHIFKLEEK